MFINTPLILIIIQVIFTTMIGFVTRPQTKVWPNGKANHNNYYENNLGTLQH